MQGDNMKIEWRSVLIVAVLFAIVMFFACAVRMPDLSLLQGRDGIDVWADLREETERDAVEALYLR